MTPIPGDPQDEARSGDVEPVARARAVARQTKGDPHRPVAVHEPGCGGAPGGEPVAAPDEPAALGAVPPPGTAEGGAAGGPPAHHRQQPV